MPNTLLCELEISGCLSYSLFYVQIVDQGGDDLNVSEAERRYAEIFGGPFVSRYCDQCFDSTSMSVTVLSKKLGQKILGRAALGRNGRNGEKLEIHRLGEKAQ